MSKMRAQVGLVFSDEDLFRNFVEPFKQQRELNSVIVRCLTAYYYNEDVRNLIEGLSLSDVTVEGVDIASSQELCDNLRQSLMMQDFLTSELKDTIEDGQENIDDILTRANDLAEASGTAKYAETEFGKGFLKIEAKNSEPARTAKSSEESTKDSPTERMFHIMFQAIVKLAEAQGNAEVLGILNSSEDENSEEEAKEVQENPSESVVIQVQSTNEEPTEDLEEKEEEILPFASVAVETPAPVEEPVVEQIVEPEVEVIDESSDDAHDSILGLLSSLG